ncbi:MAG: 30S ribosomal protein S8 [Candidatus Margulisbacteria bacterium]|nr:30S ribosomal protein S8 [Candidatus Margulisiibacteriota bacterium]
MTDPIADMLIRIKNAQRIRAENVDLPHSVIKESIAKIMVEEGYLAKYGSLKRMDKKFLRLALKYRQDNKGVVVGLKRISRPGRRVFADSHSLPRVQAGFGTAILSTSRGVMSDESARSQKVGGEVLCHIW